MATEPTRWSAHALHAGTVLHDYVVESVLGSGGFSIVYLARHRINSNWRFAIKEFLPGELAVRARDGATVTPVNSQSQEAFDDGLRRFRDEAEQLRKFRNEPYIVSCLNYFEENGTAYLVMDYDDGLPLSEFLRQRESAGQPFTETDIRAVVIPLLEGMEVVHRAGVLHRDIKPGNIFVRRQDDITGRPAHPVLIDFGAAKQNYLARHSRSLAPHTPGYAAYEQLSSEGDVGPWTDIYAVGALMWRMIAGGCAADERLFIPDGGDGAEGTGSWSPTPRAVERRSYALHRGRPDPMTSATLLGQDRFSQSLLEVVDRCLTLLPEDRVGSCEQLKMLIQRSEKLVSEDSEEYSRLDSDIESPETPIKPILKKHSVDHNLRRAYVEVSLAKARRILRALSRYIPHHKRRGRIRTELGNTGEQSDNSLPKRRYALSWRMPTARTLRITISVLLLLSLASSTFLRVPFSANESNPILENNLLGAAIRQHSPSFNLIVFVTESLFLDEYHVSYEQRKSAQRRSDDLKLRQFEPPLGTMAASTAVVLDPIVFLFAWPFLAFALHGSMLAARQGIFLGSGIWIVLSGGIFVLHLAIQEGTQAETKSIPIIVTAPFGASLGCLLLYIVGAIKRRGLHTDVAAKQNALLRIGAISGVSAPFLQFVFERLGLANDLEVPAIIVLALSASLVVPLYFHLFDKTIIFSKRREWTVWIIALGELFAHNVIDDTIGFSPLFVEFTIYIVLFPLIMIPSVFCLELLFRLFENRDVPILQIRIFRTMLLLVIGCLTLIVLWNL